MPEQKWNIADFAGDGTRARDQIGIANRGPTASRFREPCGPNRLGPAVERR